MTSVTASFNVGDGVSSVTITGVSVSFAGATRLMTFQALCSQVPAFHVPRR